MSKRIVILGTSWPYRGGLAAFNERLAAQFVREGHEVLIITFTLQYPAIFFPGTTQYSDAPEPQGLRIERLMSSVNPFSWWKTVRRVKQWRPDIVLIKFWTPFMAPCLGTIARGVREAEVVSILDNVLPHERHFYDNILIRYFFTGVDRFIAMSASVLRDCELFDTRKPKYLAVHPLYDNYGVPHDKAEARVKLDLPQDKKLFLFFGFIRDYKGLDLLLRALSDARLSSGEAQLVVAGEFYNNAETYFALEKELGIGDKIIWRTHFISDDEVGWYFSACDMVVQPYKSATQSGVTQVAYHYEKPMLVTDVGGLAEIVPAGKVGYVTAVDAKSIADALVDFLERRNSDCFLAGIREEKKKYSWEKMSKLVLNE